MSESSGFFVSSGGDRVYTPSWLAGYIEALVTTGVYSDELGVSPGEGMTVSVAAGRAWVKGYLYLNDAPASFDITLADSTLNRIDAVVLRLDLTARSIHLAVVQGSYSTEPTAPTVTRNNDVYELKLANISVPAGTTAITQQLIQDCRLDDQVCGITVSAVQHIPTGAYLDSMVAEFNDWFDSVKGILGEDEAGNLLNLIQGHTADQGNPHKVTAEQVGAAPKVSPVFTGSISLGRKPASNIGTGSFAVGNNVEGSGFAAHAEGSSSVASATASHAEGMSTKATEYCSHGEGYETEASGSYSHAEGNATIASGSSSHSEGEGTVASSSYSHAEGYQTAASKQAAHAEGIGSKASGLYSHAEGYKTEASGEAAHAEGDSTSAQGQYSHACGMRTVAKGACSFAGGDSTISNYRQFVIGCMNVESGETTSGSALTDNYFIVGNGFTARKNAFRVNASGNIYGGTYNSTGADYAEYFQWADDVPLEEDFAGRFVILDGERLRLAGPEDAWVLGILSAAPSVVGDAEDDQWHGMYLKDVFGRVLLEEQEIPAETAPDGTVLREAHRELAPVLNPDYRSGETYIPRSKRPEWAAVGLLGKLVAVDDGTCVPNGWCRPGQGGLATAAEGPTRFRVMSRLDETHIRVMILM